MPKAAKMVFFSGSRWWLWCVHFSTCRIILCTIFNLVWQFFVHSCMAVCNACFCV